MSVSNNNTIVAIMAAAIFGIVGCEPDVKISGDVTRSDNFHLADANEGSFDWPYSSNGFLVAKPGLFESLRQVPNLPLSELDQIEAVESPKFEGAEFVDFLRNVGTNEVTPFQMQPIRRVIASIPAPDGAIAMSFSLDNDLLFVGDETSVVATQLSDEWKSELPYVNEKFHGQSSDRKQEPKWKRELLPTAASTPVQLAVGGGERAVIAVARGQRVDLLDAETGEAKAGFSAPSEIEFLTAAAGANVFLATDRDGKVYWFGGDSNECQAVGCSVRPASQIQGGRSVALHSSGTAFIAFTDDQPSTHWIEGGREITAEISKDSTNGSAVALVWCESGRNWFDNERIWCDNSDFRFGDTTELFKINRTIWSPYQSWPQASQTNDERSGMTVLGMRRRRDKAAVWSIWDLSTYFGGCSCATELFTDQQLAESSLHDRKHPVVAVSQDVSRIAFLDPTNDTPTITVLYRNSWETQNVDIAYRWIKSLMFDEEYKLDQLDKVAGTILSLDDKLYWGRNKQELYSTLVIRNAGFAWHNLKREMGDANNRLLALTEIRKEGMQADPDSLSKVSVKERSVAEWSEEDFQMLVEKVRKLKEGFTRAGVHLKRWRDSGSLTSRLCEMERDMQLPRSIRNTMMGGGFADSNQLKESCQAVIDLGRDVLKVPKLPLAAFKLIFEASRLVDGDPAAMEAELLRCLKRYADCSSLHSEVGNWFQSKGNAGDVALYLDAAVRNIDAKRRDQVYGQAAIVLVPQFLSFNETYFQHSGVDKKRTFEGAMKHLQEDRPADAVWLDNLLLSAYLNRDQGDCIEATSHYYRENFIYADETDYKRYPEIMADRPQPR